MIILEYDKGTILIRGGIGTPYGKWDPRLEVYRALAIYYRDILEYLKRSEVEYKDNVPDFPPCSRLSGKMRLRTYQRSALNAWIEAERRGVIVLPTGAGKTFIALQAIQILNVSSLIVVPTLDLLDQWRNNLAESFNVDVGVYGGGEEVLRALTVSTYDSAYIRGEQLGNRFCFIVFDEVHHLPASCYSQIAEMYIGPYRMGLTATLEREDGQHKDLPRLVGDVVYTIDVDALTGRHLSPYTHEKILVELLPEERETYNTHFNLFSGYLRRKGIIIRTTEDFHNFIMRTGRDPQAREALLARNIAVKTALNSEAKITCLGDLLEKYRGEKIIIFTLHNQLVYKISSRFLIPAITYQTSKEERREILDKFRMGQYRIIVTSQVLDEGIDVPDASVGLIISGTGSTREYIQRLGRILRKKEKKKAKLIEIVANGTVETRISQRRRNKKSEKK